MTNCTFTENESIAGAGGGISIGNGSISVINSTFSNNVAVDGGALRITGHPQSTYEIANSFFFSNSAERGGGISIYEGFDLVFTNNTLVETQRATTVEGLPSTMPPPP